MVTPANPAIINGTSRQLTATGTYSDNAAAVIVGGTVTGTIDVNNNTGGGSLTRLPDRGPC